jgi:hypothetical protein
MNNPWQDAHEKLVKTPEIWAELKEKLPFGNTVKEREKRK